MGRYHGRRRHSRDKSSNKKKEESCVDKRVREQVTKVLEDDTALAEKRARFCDVSGFLKLLYSFNLAGIQFC